MQINPRAKKSLDVGPTESAVPSETVAQPIKDTGAAKGGVSSQPMNPPAGAQTLLGCDGRAPEGALADVANRLVGAAQPGGTTANFNLNVHFDASSRRVDPVAVAEALTKQLDPDGDRFRQRIAKQFDVNHFNYGYPEFDDDKLPLEVSTPFKYMRLPAQRLDDTHIAMVVQQEGGVNWLDEDTPCREALVLLEWDASKGVYREVDSYWIGCDQRVEPNERLLVERFEVNADASMNVVWWRAGYYSNTANYSESTFVRDGTHLQLTDTHSLRST
jgi:hypothetical protein